MKWENEKTFSCDFETTTDKNDCRVWAWGMSNIEDTNDKLYGNNIDSFMNEISQHNYKLYFHNLKFDGEFILSWLLNNGFTYFDKSPKSKQFHTIISNTGLWYSIEIYWKRTKRETIKTLIWDSLKLLPFSVNKLAHDFKLPIKKLHIDYNEERPKGHELTEQERDYLFNDIDIVAMCLKQSFNEGFKKMTSSSSSFLIYQQEIEVDYKKYFPVLDIEIDSELRPAYYGGFVWTNPAKQEKVIINGIVFDVNSLYPSRMVNELLPYGEPLRFEGKYKNNPEYPLWVGTITFSFEIKKGHIPCITLDKSGFSFSSNKYEYSSNGENVTLTLSSIDWELINEQYKIDVDSYGGGFMFKGKKGIATPYINNCMEVKKKEKGAKRAIAKLKMNSVYGKYATNPDVTPKIPYLDENGILKLKNPTATILVKEKDEYVLKEVIEKEYRKPIYLPYGIFTTAYARRYTITTAQKVGLKRLCYIDTDSIHLEGTTVPKAIEDIVDDKELGMWGLESIFKRAYFVGSKAYVEEIQIEEEEYKSHQEEYKEDNGAEDKLYYKRDRIYYRLNVKCAGMTEKAKQNITFETFRVGTEVPDCLKTTHVKGGIVLVDKKFKIKKR